MKRCCTCREDKKIEDFYKDRGAEDGHEARCKICRKKSQQKSYFAHKDKIRARKLRWGHKHPEMLKAQQGRYYNSHRSHFRAKVQARQAAQLQRTPPWVNLSAIKEIFAACPPGFEVDHMVPLCGKIVSGLHVPWNLQYLTRKENRKKWNNF